MHWENGLMVLKAQDHYIPIDRETKQSWGYSHYPRVIVEYKVWTRTGLWHDTRLQVLPERELGSQTM